MEKSKRENFAKGHNLYKYFLIFVIGCVIGYVYETILCVFQQGCLESKQGLVYGPFIPVYGLGAVLFMFAFKKRQNLVWVFIFSTILGGILEFFYSFFQEMFFGTVSWDYKEYFMNFQGRTSILHALFWGIVGVVFVKWIYPFLSNLIEKIPNKTGVVVSWMIGIFMIFNIYISIVSSHRQYQRHNNIAPSGNIGRFFDIHYPDEKLDKIYDSHIRVK